jgi:hypothetical protein
LVDQILFLRPKHAGQEQVNKLAIPWWIIMCRFKLPVRWLFCGSGILSGHNAEMPVFVLGIAGASLGKGFKKLGSLETCSGDLSKGSLQARYLATNFHC